jgi:hypothetical protein
LLYRSLKLKEFKKFESATAALNEAAALGEGKVTPLLSSLLDSLKDEKKGSLAVADSKLASSIGKPPNRKSTAPSETTSPLSSRGSNPTTWIQLPSVSHIHSHGTK